VIDTLAPPACNTAKLNDKIWFSIHNEECVEIFEKSNFYTYNHVVVRKRTSAETDETPELF
jgi:hypothetical protein